MRSARDPQSYRFSPKDKVPSRSSSARGFGRLLASDFAGGRAPGRLPGLQGPPRSPDRTRSPVAVSRKREYFKYPRETICDFALRLSKLGAWRRRTNLQKTAIGGYFCDLREYNLQLKDCLAGAGGFEPPYGGIKIHCLTTWRRPNGLIGKRQD